MDNNRIKCPKCQSEELEFINLPYQTKKKYTLFFAIFVLTFNVFFFSFLSLIALLFSGDILSIIVSGYATLISGGASLLLYLFSLLFPLESHNDLHIVCRNCGNIESIKKDEPDKEFVD